MIHVSLSPDFKYSTVQLFTVLEILRRNRWSQSTLSTEYLLLDLIMFSVFSFETILPPLLKRKELRLLRDVGLRSCPSLRSPGFDYSRWWPSILFVSKCTRWKLVLCLQISLIRSIILLQETRHFTQESAEEPCFTSKISLLSSMLRQYEVLTGRQLRTLLQITNPEPTPEDAFMMCNISCIAWSSIATFASLPFVLDIWCTFSANKSIKFEP